ncbi:MAG TPA: hypothetical protein PK720_03930 [bacterium]|nr:hypothetical protein [bacterium]
MIFHHSRQNKIIIPLIIIAIAALLFGIIINHYQTTIQKLELRITELEKNSSQPNNPGDNKSNNPNPEDSDSRVSYANSKYHYNLRYPANLEIKVVNDKRAFVGVIDTSTEDEYVAGKVQFLILEDKEISNLKSKFEETSFNSIKKLCDADGSGASISCPRKKSFAPLTITSGLSAYTLTLEQDTKTFVPTEVVTSDERQFYIVDLSLKNTSTILVIYAIGDGTNELAKQIAESVTNNN